MYRALIVLIAIILAFLIFVEPVGKQELSDDDLLKYAKSLYDKKEMMFKDFILGYHNGVPVRVSFPCSDVCPEGTIRIIRYDVNLSQCISVGGEIKAIYVPFGISSKIEKFCFPKIIVKNRIYNFVDDR